MFDFLGVIGDDEGSWGSLYGDAATDGFYLILDENGNVVSSSLVPSFQTSGGKNAQYDVSPESQAYSVEVGGSNTSKTLTITKK